MHVFSINLFDVIMTKFGPLKKRAIDLCDTSLYPKENYLFNDVSYMENVRLYFKIMP